MCLFSKQPTVSTTNYILSLCMFIGYYFLLNSSIFQNITSSMSIHGSKLLFRTFICMFDISILNEMFTTSLVAAVHKVRGHYERK